MNTLNMTYPHFVRCIIPNEVKTGGILDAHLVLHQLHCNGVLEGIRICRKGFPSRVAFGEFLQRYCLLSPVKVKEYANEPAKACAAILEEINLDLELYRVGNSKVLFKAGVLGKLEELRDVAIEKSIVVIQCYVRQYLAKKEYMDLLVKQLAIGVLQRNMRVYIEIRSWPWMKLYEQLVPYIEFLKEQVREFLHLIHMF